MNNFLNFQHLFRLFSNLRILYQFLLVFLVCSFNVSGQEFSCGSNATTIPNTVNLNCDLSTINEKCIRIKFHYINNTNDPDKSFTDQQFMDMLTCMNTYYSSVKLRLTFHNNCITRMRDTSITDATVLSEKMGNKSERDKLNFQDSSINIYFFQKAFGNYGGKWSKKSDSNIEWISINPITFTDYCLTLTHEMGHAMGLIHTFGPALDESNAPLDESLWECKSRTGCSVLGDGICDTGPDPWAMNLDSVPGRDRSKWVRNSYINGCQILISPSRKDICQDSINSWDIPTKNIMSYYLCAKEFTPCQAAFMHQHLVLEDSSKTIINCADDLAPMVKCNHIIIDVPTVWKKGFPPYPSGELGLCTNQKIIIQAGASLTLDNFKLTKLKSPNPNCPTLNPNGNWDGIYINSSSSNSTPGFGTNPPVQSSNNDFIAKNGSVIEYSNNGIQASGSFNKIEINNSTLLQNGSAITTYRAKSGNIIVSGSTIDASAGKARKQINIGNNNITVASSMITSGAKLIAIYTESGTCSIINSTIKDFAIAIDKSRGFGSQLKILNCPLIKADTAIIDHCMMTLMSYNLIDGGYIHGGSCIGSITRNQFKTKNVIIENTQRSFLFQENFFNQVKLIFTDNNPMCMAYCNTFEKPASSSESVMATGAMPKQWGGQEGMSGNIYVGAQPEFSSITDIVNYHKDQNTIFNYKIKFVGTSTTNGRNCNYNNYRKLINDSPAFVEAACSDPTLDLSWQSISAQRAQVLSSIQLLGSQDASYDSLYHLLELYDVDLDQIVSKGLTCSMADGSASSYNTWSQRLDAETQLLNSIKYAFDAENFSSAALLSQGATASVIELSAFNTALLILKDYILAGKNIYLLSQAEVELVKIEAQKSSGNLSNILRAFLNTYYDIEIRDIDGQSENRTAKNIAVAVVNKNTMNIYPNPVENCFIVDLYSDTEEKIKLSLIDLQGKAIYSWDYKKYEQHCFPTAIKKGLYVIKADSNFNAKKSRYSKIMVN